MSLSTPAHATDILWNGATTGTLDWNTGGNWVGGSYPDSSSDRGDLRKDWSSTPTINLSAPVTINGVLFDDTGGSGSTTLTLGNGGTTNNTFTLAGTSPSFSVAVTTLTVSANLLGSGGLTKSGAGTLLLSGSNSLTGDVIVSAGTLRTGTNNALNSGNTVRVDSGATLNVSSSVSIAGLNDNAGSGGSVAQSSGGGKVLTIAGAGSYNFGGNFNTGGGNKVGLLLSGTGTQVLGGYNVTNTGYQSVTGGGTLVFAKQDSIFQGLATGAVVNANSSANAGISVSSGGTLALGVGASASGYFDATAIGTFLDGTHMGLSSNSQGFRNNSILAFDTANATGGTFTYSTALANIGSSTGIGFAKLGAGTLVLDAANTYSGVTQVRSGTLQIGAGSTTGSIGSSGDITVSSGATLAFNRSDTTSTVSAKITGGGSVVQNGSGGTILDSTTSDYSGGTTISSGRLTAKTLGSGAVTINGSGVTQLKLSASTTYSNSISIGTSTGTANQGLIDTDTGINAVLAGPISITGTPSTTTAGHFGSSGTGSIRIDGAISSTVPVIFRRGTIILTASNGYATSTVISNGGTLQIGNGSTTGSIASTSGVTNNGTLSYNRSDNFSATYAVSGSGNVTKNGAGTLTLSGTNSYSGGTLISAGAVKGDTTSLQGAITNNAAAIFETATNGTYAGVMSGTGTVAKTGAGTLTLTATNTYNGATTVETGKLVVNGAISNSAVTLQNGTALGGSGVVGSTTVLNGATIAPGNSPGKLTINGDLTWNNGGNYDWEVLKLPSAGVAGTDWDLLSVSGTLNLTNLSGAPLFKINLYSSALAGWSSTGTYAWKILEAGNTISTNYISPSYIGINTSSFTNDTSGGLFALELRDNSKGLYLTYSSSEAVPEPGTWAAAALLASCAGFLRWRKRRRS